MSADNYYLIRKRADGKFVPVMGFASDDTEPEIRFGTPWFDTVGEAFRFASEDGYTEYGVRVHPECGSDW